MSIIDGTPGDDNLIGTFVDDMIRGFAGNDTLIGSFGNDTLDGGEGADIMDGGIGNDVLVVDNPLDVVIGGEGFDLVVTSIDFSLLNPLRSDIENLVLDGLAILGEGNNIANAIQGNNQNNELLGRAGNDQIRGGSGNDTIRGGLGEDLILGQLGEDVLYGGLNADIFAFSSSNPSEGVDLITDFNKLEGDKIGITLFFEATSISQFSTRSDTLGNIYLFFGIQELAIIQEPVSGFDLNTDLVFLDITA